MAAGDTALWLHNKLGSTDDLWSGKSICSQLSREKLISIQACFHALQSHVKVKLLVSFLHIPRRNVEQWQSDLDEVILLGINDPDPWVATIGEIMREFPSNGSLLMVEQDNRSDSVMLVCLDEMKALAESASVQMMPLECQYLNKASLAAAAGPMAEPAKHFTVKRKPKSAALRAEVVHKSSETLLNKRNHASSSVPIKSRSFAKQLDMTPLKMPPSRSMSSDYRSPNSSMRIGSPLGRSPMTPMSLTPRHHSSAKKDSKIKLLEIEEMPVGAKEAKRRKKIAEMAQETQRKEREAAAAASATVSTGGTTTAITATTAPTPASYTPDYAAGLMAPVSQKMPMSALGASSQPTPAYLPSSARPNAGGLTLGGVGSLSSTQSSKSIQQKTHSQQLKQHLLKTTPSPASTIITTNPGLVLPHTATSDPQLLQQNLGVVGGTPDKPGIAQVGLGSIISTHPSATTMTMVRPNIPQQTVFVPAQGVLTPGLRPGQQRLAMRPVGPVLQNQIMQQQGLVGVPSAGLTRLAAPTNQLQPMNPTPVVPASAPANPTQTAAPAKKNLSLTKEQMSEAQEMFRVSNKVSRPEKALILGFMAGSRENPCPQQGDILNIRLSEKETVVQMPDGNKKKRIEDTYFQMNYATGEWRRFSKSRDAVIS